MPSISTAGEPKASWPAITKSSGLKKEGVSAWRNTVVGYNGNNRLSTVAARTQLTDRLKRMALYRFIKVCLTKKVELDLLDNGAYHTPATERHQLRAHTYGFLLFSRCARIGNEDLYLAFKNTSCVPHRFF